MRILQPHKISGEIVDLIYQAQQYLVIISPYVSFKNWDRIVSEFLNAKKRGVRIDFFVRNDADNFKSWEAVESLGVRPRLINNLHAKFYLNEQIGVISSMNLLASSNSDSIEIGCKTDSEAELEELRRFVKDFILPNEVKDKPQAEDLYLSKEKFIYVLENYLSNALQRNVSVRYVKGDLQINTRRNNYTLGTDKVQYILFITGILSGIEADHFEEKGIGFFKSGYFKPTLHRGGQGYYDHVVATSQEKISSTYLDNLKVHEKKSVVNEVTNFIMAVEEYKEACYQQRLT